MAANSRGDARPVSLAFDLGRPFEPFLFVVRGMSGTG
jgi:hypothetical protein